MSYWNVFDQILSRNSLISVPQRVLARMIYAVSYLTCSRNCIWRHREFEPACPVHLWILSLFSTSFFSCHITTEHWKHKLTDYRDNLFSSNSKISNATDRYAALWFLKNLYESRPHYSWHPVPQQAFMLWLLRLNMFTKHQSKTRTELCERRCKCIWMQASLTGKKPNPCFQPP